MPFIEHGNDGHLAASYCLETVTAIPSSGGGDTQAAKPQPPPPARGAAAWRPWTVALAFIGAFGLALAGRALVTTVAGEGESVLVGGTIVLILLSVSSVGLAVLLANMHGRPTAGDFGLRRPRIARAIALTLTVWITLTVLTVLWISALGLDGEEGQALTDRLGTDGTLTVVILIVVLTILTPIEEEFLFRGYIFRTLRNWRGVWPAAGTTGLLFAAIHVGWVPIALVIIIVPFGIGLCLLYHWTASLYPGIAFHTLNNSVPLGSALNWTWQTPLLMVVSTLAALTLARLIAVGLGDRHATQATSPTG